MIQEPRCPVLPAKETETDRETVCLRHEVTQNQVCFHRPSAHQQAAFIKIHSYTKKKTQIAPGDKNISNLDAITVTFTEWNSSHSYWESIGRACRCVHIFCVSVCAPYPAGRQSDEWMGVNSWRSGGATEITLLTTVTSACSHSLRPVLMEARALFWGQPLDLSNCPLCPGTVTVTWPGVTDACFF